jgi:serine/threonine protein kinase
MKRTQKIAQLWKALMLIKPNDSYKSPNPTKDAAFKKNVTVGLQNLNTHAKPGMTAESAEGQQFQKLRDRTCVTMRNYCRSIKTIAKQQMFKRVQRLTLVVTNLTLVNLDDEGGLSDKELEKVDTTALDKLLLQNHEDESDPLAAQPQAAATQPQAAASGQPLGQQPAAQPGTGPGRPANQAPPKPPAMWPVVDARIKRLLQEAQPLRDYAPVTAQLKQKISAVTTARSAPGATPDAVSPALDDLAKTIAAAQAYQAKEASNVAFQLRNYDACTYPLLAAYDAGGAVKAQRDVVAQHLASPTAGAAAQAESAMKDLLQKTEVLIKVKDVTERLQKFDATDYPKVATLDAGQLRDQRDVVDQLQTGGQYNQAAAELTKLEKMTGLVAKLTTVVDPSKLAVGKEIGAGSCGAVHAVNTGDPTKKLVLKTAFTKFEDELKKEAEAYALLGDHPNIVKCYGNVKIGNKSGILMEELEGGDLSDSFKELENMRKAGALSEPEYWTGLQHMFRGVFSGLAHMEKAGFVHNDIKGDNVRIDLKSGEAKLIDVGLVTAVGGASQSGHERMAAPEKLAAKDVRSVPSSAAQDSYSAGQMLHEQAEGKPFAFGDDISNKSRGQAISSLFDGAPRYMEKNAKTNEMDQRALKPEQPGAAATAPGKYAAGFDSAYVDFLNQLMHPDPAKRLTPSKALEHRFLAEGLDTEEDTAHTVMARVLAGDEQLREETELAKLRQQALDAEDRDDDSAEAAAKKKIADLEAKIKARQEEEAQAVRVLEQKIAAAAQDMAARGKAWKADAAAADKAQAGALKVVGPVEQALMQGKVTQATAGQMAKLVQSPLDPLSKLETQLADHREKLTEATRQFGDLIVHREMLMAKQQKAGQAVAKDMQKDTKSGRKTLDKLAKWSRQATAAHATVTRTIVTMKELQDEVEEVAKSAQPAPRPTTDMSVQKKAVESMVKAFPAWESVIEQAQREHEQTTRLMQESTRALAQGQAGGAVNGKELDALKQRASEIEKQAATIPAAIDEAEKRLKAYEMLVGTRTRQGKGQRVAAAGLDQEAVKTLIRAKGYASQLRNTGRMYQEDIRALSELIDADDLAVPGVTN